MKTLEITGLGPLQEDGSLDLFTVEAQPTRVTKAWLDQFLSLPSVGDQLLVAEDGMITLVPFGVAEAGAPDEGYEEPEKKSLELGTKSLEDGVQVDVPNSEVGE